MKFFSIILLAASGLLLFSCGPDPVEVKVYPKATNLFFANYSGKEVGEMDINITGLYNVIADNSDGLDTITGIAIDFIGGQVYGVEELKNRVVRFNIDGSGSLEVLYDEEDSVNTPTSIALHVASRTVYWANSGTAQLKKGSMDGGEASSIKFKLDSVISYCYGLAVDSKNEIIFFSDMDKYPGIWYGKTDGSLLPDKVNSISILFGLTSGGGTVLRNPSAIYLDEETQRIFWADEGLNVISVGAYAKYQEAYLTGASSVALFNNFDDGVVRPDGVAIDKGSKKIYWTETSETGKRIVRGNLDGTEDPETILEDVESYSIVLQFPEKE